jgi:hypothetical protein
MLIIYSRAIQSAQHLFLPRYLVTKILHLRKSAFVAIGC